MVEKYWKHYTIILLPCMDHGHWPSSMFLLVLAAQDRYNKTADTDFSEMHTHKSYSFLYRYYVVFKSNLVFFRRFAMAPHDLQKYASTMRLNYHFTAAADHFKLEMCKKYWPFLSSIYLES